MSQYQRRQFFVYAGALLASPLVRAQQAVPLRRVGVLVGGVNDPKHQAEVAALHESLQQLGWINGRNIEIDLRWGEGKIAVMRAQAEALVNAKPEVIAVSTATGLREVQRVAGKTPIVFWGVSDPVGNNFVQSLAHPGANTTGFSLFQYELGGKWLQLLREAAPQLKRVLLLMNANNPNWPGWLRAIEAVALSLGLELIRPTLTVSTQIEPVISKFARKGYGGLLVLPDPFVVAILKQLAQYRMPSICGFQDFSDQGGLLTYGVDEVDLARRAAVYISRVLNGNKPAELPVEQPSRFVLIINMKTAKGLKLKIPQSLLTRADRVIE